ncbi:MAG: exonuclease subunit SbcD [Cyanobacteria bacterium J06638_22]
MIKLLHLSDIHLGSGFTHGYLNPETGLNTRFEDFVKALSLCVDRAIADSVDLVLFGGDAFPDATPPPRVQEAFASQFRRLADAHIPMVLLVGNHDQHAQGQGGDSLCIYRTLGVPGVVVGDRLATHRIATASGEVQVITLPWITRSTLLTRAETEDLSVSAINDLLIDRLRVALEGEIRALDADVPTVLLGHLMADTAQFGAERFLAAGKGFTVPLALLARSYFDYVALGHVHRHQVLCDAPLVVYPGSIERVDFSEEKEEKGFVRVDLERGRAEMEFCPLPVRPFHTLRLDVSEAEEPQQKLLAAIARTPIEDAVVRLIFQLQSHQMEQVDLTQLQVALQAAHTHSIYPELTSQLTRPRLPELGSSNGLDPLEALDAYLENAPHLADLSTDMRAAAAALMTPDVGVDWETDLETRQDSAEEAIATAQLRLL